MSQSLSTYVSDGHFIFEKTIHTIHKKIFRIAPSRKLVHCIRTCSISILCKFYYIIRCGSFFMDLFILHVKSMEINIGEGWKGRYSLILGRFRHLNAHKKRTAINCVIKFAQNAT